MIDYEQQAKDFLAACGAKIRIRFIGKEINHMWNEKKHRNKYHFTITTPLGKMEGDFWDSISNTEHYWMSYAEFYEKSIRKFPDGVTPKDFPTVTQFLAAKKKYKPNAYDILACLEKYDVGSMDDFFAKTGTVIKSVNDMTNFIATYNAVVKEYNDLCRIFTPEQMEMLREIY